MRILFVASRFPYPPIQGDRVRGYHFLRLMSKRHSITLVTPVTGSVDSQAQQAVTQLCKRWVPVHVRQWQSVVNTVRFPFCALPLQTLYFCPQAIRKQVQTLSQTEAFSLVHVQLARVAPVADGLDGVPKVLDFIDALSLNMRRRAMLERGLVKWFFHLEARRMARYERELVVSFDRQAVSSPLDKETIGASESMHVIPNGVDIKDFPYNEDERENNVIVFTGRIGYFPNADAAIYFATQVFPLVLRQEPGTRFLIVGADPPRRVRRLAQLPGITVTGYVPRIQDYLTRATVAVAPLQTGSGIQNKVLEAMACGTPVVATPSALGGIEAEDGKHLLVAEDAEALAEQVVRMFRDQALRRHLARNAHRLIEEKYTWERSVAMLEEVYRLAVQE
ncbi:MAG: TIGR03087 family PEP-CTERM/XrtA system glycosyltransferase [Anaerolineae bacterium]